MLAAGGATLLPSISRLFSREWIETLMSRNSQPKNKGISRLFSREWIETRCK